MNSRALVVLVMIALLAGSQINSVLDGFVYGALAGLGFQVVENIVFALNAVDLAGAGDRGGPVVATFLLRGFLGGLWSHTLFTALAGAGVAYEEDVVGMVFVVGLELDLEVGGQRGQPRLNRRPVLVVVAHRILTIHQD